MHAAGQAGDSALPYLAMASLVALSLSLFYCMFSLSYFLFALRFAVPLLAGAPASGTTSPEEVERRVARPPVARMPMVDALKGLACMAIVLHHLAFYGPMSDTALPLAPGLIAWLYDYGRMAVQVFLVVSGFLAAASLAPAGIAHFERPGPLLLRRYARLAMPYLFALTCSIAVAALVRPWLQHESVPDEPGLLQLLSHVLLLQGLLGHEALSAGVWYVAIDFQLFTLAVAGLWVARRLGRGDTPGRLPLGILLVAGLTLASLLYFNLDTVWDNTALYFFGAYGMGMLAFWAGRVPRPHYGLAALAGLGLAALLVAFRVRIATAVVCAVWLGAAQAWPSLRQWPRQAQLQAVGRMSYSVFLIHFPVCLLVNAVVSHLWPTQPWPNLLGMLLALGLSLAAGAWLHHRVEVQPLSLRRLLGVQAGLVVVGLVA